MFCFIMLGGGSISIMVSRFLGGVIAVERVLDEGDVGNRPWMFV